MRKSVQAIWWGAWLCGCSLPGANWAASILSADDAAERPAAYLGVRVGPLPHPSGPDHGPPVPGLRVTEVDAGSPAAGLLQPADTLLQIDGQILFNGPQLRALLNTLHPGDSADLLTMHDGVTQAVTVVLSESMAAAPWSETDASTNAAQAEEAAWPAASPPGGLLDDAELDAIMERIRNSYESSLPRDRLDDVQETQFLNSVRKQIAAAQLAPPSTNADDYVRRQYAATVLAPSDDEHTTIVGGEDGSLSVFKRNGETVYSYRDSGGNVIYEGPVESDADRKRIPLDAWKMYYQLERNGLEDSK